MGRITLICNRCGAKVNTDEETPLTPCNCENGAKWVTPKELADKLFNELHPELSQLSSKQKKKALEEIKEKPYELHDLSYFRKLKCKHKDIVQGFLSYSTLNMWSAPPKSLKSIISEYFGLCVATGTQFFGLKTKKEAVLKIDLENPLADKKEHFLKIYKGMGLKRNPKFYYFPVGEIVDVYSPLFVEKIARTIEEYGIKVIILDTLRRMSPELKENDADDVSKFYRNFFIPLRDKYGVSVIFLHHRDKGNKNYRGSTDLLAMVDSHYIFSKQGKGSSVSFSIKLDCARGDYIENIYGGLDFEEEAFKFSSLLKDSEQTSRTEEWKQVYSSIKDYFNQVGQGISVKRGTLNAYLYSRSIDIVKKRGTITRILDLLQEQKFLEQNKKGSYSLLYSPVPYVAVGGGANIQGVEL